MQLKKKKKICLARTLRARYLDDPLLSNEPIAVQKQVRQPQFPRVIGVGIKTPYIRPDVEDLRGLKLMLSAQGPLRHGFCNYPPSTFDMIFAGSPRDFLSRGYR